MLSSSSPNYSPVRRCTASSQRNGVVRKHARPELGDGRDGGQQGSQLQQPFYKAEKQHTNININNNINLTLKHWSRLTL